MDLIAKYNSFEIKFWDNTKLIFSGARSTERFRYIWELSDSEKNTISKIKLKPYIISFSLNEEYLISYVFNNITYSLILFYKVKKAPHYKVVFNDDLYEIIVHKGTKISFFKNHLQFAYLIEQPISIGFSRKLNIVADDDINISFFCTIIYAIICKQETDDGNINFNIGNLSPELRKFDTQWQPKLKFSN